MKLLWIVLLVLFVLVNVYAFVAGDQLVGLIAFLKNLSPWGVLLIVDLLIALTVALSFIAKEAQLKKVSVIPYIGLTLLTGSIGILVYLIRYGGRSKLQRVQGGAEE